MLLSHVITNEVLSKRHKHSQYHTPEPKDISPSSTMSWPTSKTVNKLVCLTVLFILWTVYCVLYIVYSVLYRRPTVHFILPYILLVQLLGCHSCNKDVSCLICNCDCWWHFSQCPPTHLCTNSSIFCSRCDMPCLWVLHQSNAKTAQMCYYCWNEFLYFCRL